LSGKSFTDENFPVSSFIIEKKKTNIIRNFYFFARTADDVADNNLLMRPEKEKILKFFDNILKKKTESKIKVINNLIKTCKEKNIPIDYARSLLKAFILDAKKKRYRNWNELLEYCKYSANPVGRFFIDIYYTDNKEKNLRNVYDASDNLCSALQILNHLQDCKEDFLKLNRVYIPLSFFKTFSLSPSNLKLPESDRDFWDMKNSLVFKVEEMLKGAKKNLKLIEFWRLRKETLIIFHIAQKLCYLLKNKDPLKKKVKLSRIDLIFCFLKGIIEV